MTTTPFLPSDGSVTPAQLADIIEHHDPNRRNRFLREATDADISVQRTYDTAGLHTTITHTTATCRYSYYSPYRQAMYEAQVTLFQTVSSCLDDVSVELWICDVLLTPEEVAAMAAQITSGRVPSPLYRGRK